MDSIFVLNCQSIDYKKITDILNSHQKIKLSDQTKKKIINSETFLKDFIKKSKQPIYGINTGFGALCNTIINDSQLKKLQYNLIISHACGLGEVIPEKITRIMMLLKIINLSHGFSGVQLQTIERMIYFFNNNITPVVYEKGSLGASGDLAPLAHLSLPIIGLGEVIYKNKKHPAKKILNDHHLTPIILRAKEGLALINGTQFMSAFGVYALAKYNELIKIADFNLSVGIVSFNCKLEPFNLLLHKIRPHKGQYETAKKVLEFLKDYDDLDTKQIQDPYSFRCSPQVHGACKDVFEHVKNTVDIEINSITDNPTIFKDNNLILSGGNFHGQPLAMCFDYLSLAIAELGSISERRIYKLQNGQRGLPPFLTTKSGLNSGYMITQYSAAAIVSQNKQLASPTSVDTIDSSNGQEDHVSMGANGGVKLKKMIENLEFVLAIELLNNFQALELRKLNTIPKKVNSILKKFRTYVKFSNEDTIMYKNILKSKEFIYDYWNL